VERRNQTVVEMVRCMMKSMQVPSRFWAEATSAAIYVLSKSPTKSLQNKTPFEAWHGMKPNVSHLKVFGCIARVKLVGPGLTKLVDRSKKMVFLGYESRTKGYRLLDLETNKMVVSRDVIFEEYLPWEWNKVTNVSQSVSDTFIV
jgi:hypothetical protein